ncbi:E3 ubiquitin-protein transferase RMND5B isoform X2 [Moschus berezovskii]|uniref:E3 ubiquitin-protein transferase RMND5B isoform X2 n=1 Tax=Moschus berezovskii TaxID=68408 RepID=UPI00244399F1|nr:E3 ubiquitin-protein transferase RMND5B isoform X2 [Moschus berezovskii]
MASGSVDSRTGTREPAAGAGERPPASRPGGAAQGRGAEGGCSARLPVPDLLPSFGTERPSPVLPRVLFSPQTSARAGSWTLAFSETFEEPPLLGKSLEPTRPVQLRSRRVGAVQGTPLSATLSLVMSQCCRKIKDTVQKLASDHKDIHSSVSRVGKAIDRNFDSEICGVVSDAVWDSREKQQQTLQMAILEHLYQQGMLSVAEELCQESTLNVDLDFKQPFLELNRILEALHEQDLGPALEWAVSHRQRLLELNSSLEFKLHRLQFIRLLAGGPEKQLEALSYARHFQPFAHLHQREIQVMMGSLVYLQLGLEKSPYGHLLDNSHWAEICETFTRDACSLLGLSVESPLSVSFASGCVALPVLMNIKAVMEQRQCSGVWSHKDELPIEIELGMKCWYHSVFACPILRQQTSDSNPPIKLICGHVISRDALNKLINGGKLKCPYCPMEQNPADGKRIIF